MEKSGTLFKKGGIRRNWTQRTFKLGAGALLYYDKDKLKGEIPTRFIKECGEATKEVGKKSGRDNIFEIVTEERTYYLSAENPGELIA